MGFKSTFKKGFGSGLNPKKWIGAEQIKQDSKSLAGILKSVFRRVKKQEKKKETFDQAIYRFRLTEEDIQERMSAAKKIVFILLGISGALFVYTLYQWFVVSRFLSGFICLILMFLTLAYAFREHFNLFQMRQRRLGCSYKEWFKDTFNKVK